MEKAKIAVITGGSRGLGRNMAQKLAENGNDVVITYNTNQEEAQKVVSEIERSGRKAAAIRLNTASMEDVHAFPEALTEVLGSVFGAEKFDFLINNAGVGLITPIGQTKEEDFDFLVNIHFKGVYFLTQSLSALINNGGRIVFLSTGLTRVSRNTGYAVYASVKGAIEVLTRYMAVDLGPRGISVNNIAPGAIETDFGGGVIRDNAQYNKMVADNTALGRAGLPDDIGGVVAFLCSKEGGWINGQRIEVSGGMNL